MNHRHIKTLIPLTNDPFTPPEDYILFGTEALFNAAITIIGFIYFIRSKSEFSTQQKHPIFLYYASRFLSLVLSGIFYFVAFNITSSQKKSDLYKNLGLCFYQSLGSILPSCCVICSISCAMTQLFQLNQLQTSHYINVSKITYSLFLINLALNFYFTFSPSDLSIFIMINTEIFAGVLIVFAIILLIIVNRNDKQQKAQNSQHSMTVHQLWLYITAWTSYIIINTTITVLNNQSSSQRYYSGFDAGFDVAFSVLCSVLFIVPKRVSQEYLYELIDMVDQDGSQTGEGDLGDDMDE